MKPPPSKLTCAYCGHRDGTLVAQLVITAARPRGRQVLAHQDCIADRQVQRVMACP